MATIVINTGTRYRSGHGKGHRHESLKDMTTEEARIVTKAFGKVIETPNSTDEVVFTLRGVKYTNKRPSRYK